MQTEQVRQGFRSDKYAFAIVGFQHNSIFTSAMSREMDDLGSIVQESSAQVTDSDSQLAAKVELITVIGTADTFLDISHFRFQAESS